MIRQTVVEIILKFGLGGCGGSGGTWRSGCLRRQGFDSHKISIKLFLTKKMIKRPGIYENAEMRQNWLIRRFEDLKLLLKGVSRSWEVADAL